MSLSQTERLVRYLREHDGATSLEITLAIGCVNVTGRVSDARAAGHEVVCKRGPDGRFRYFIEPTARTTLFRELDVAS